MEHEAINSSEGNPAGKTLLNNEFILSKMVANIGDVIVIIDQDGTNRYKSPNVEKWFGWKAEELVGASTWDNVHPDDLEFAQRFIDEVASVAGGAGTVECRYRCKDGSYKWIEFTGSNLFDDPDIHGILGNYHDITERRLAEEALRESEASFRSTINDLLVGVVVHAADSSVLLSNPQSRTILGLSADQIAGETAIDPAWEFIREDGSVMTVEDYPVSRVLATKQPISNLTLGIKRPDRSSVTWVLVSAVPVFTNQQTVNRVVVNFLDVTKQKQAAEEEILLKDQLVQSKKMEMIGRLAGGVAHDFNNVLQSILGYAELAEAQVGSNERVRSDLGEIQHAARHAADLTRQLLSFARKQEEVVQQLQLNLSVESMLNMIKPLLGRAVELVWLPGEDLWSVLMEPTQLDQVLVNLCINARDAMGDSGGRLTIQTENRWVERPLLSCGGEIPFGEYVVLIISDTGRGMDSEAQERLFEPFYTAKDVGLGAGLGLSMVHGMIQQSGGFVVVDSSLEKGTSFRIYLPRGSGAEIAPAKLGIFKPAFQGSETVLVVEDEDAILSVSARVLRMQGYTVLAAASPQIALRLVMEYEGTIDLLLADVNLPEMSGHKLAEILGKQIPGLKLLFMSGDSENMQQAVDDDSEAQLIPLLPKPFSIEMLTKKVREILDAPQ